MREVGTQEALKRQRVDSDSSAPRRPTSDIDAAVLSPGAMLGLQRTAGNGAVVRALGRRGPHGPLLQRAPADGAYGASADGAYGAPAEGANSVADPFWDNLSRDTTTRVLAWLNAHQFGAIEQFSDDMSTGGGADVGEIAATASIGFVSAIRVHGNLAAALLNLVKLVYEGITADKPMKLAAFLDKLRDNGAALSDRLAIGDPKEPYFALIEQAKAREAGGEVDADARDAAAAAVDALIKQLPSKDRIQTVFMRDWLDSSQDTWDIDMGGTKAGYIFVRATYYEPVGGRGTWRLDHAPYIDDASNPDGFITALTNVFTADTPLELLPFQMVVSAYIEKENPGEPKRLDRRWGAELVSPSTGSSDLRSSATWVLRDGDRSFLGEWLAGRPKPTVSALVAEGLWN